MKFRTSLFACLAAVAFGQTAAVDQQLTAARNELVAASLTLPRNDAAIRAKAQAIGVAELAVAKAGLSTAGRGGGRGGPRGPVGVPDLSPAQGSALVNLNSLLAPLIQKLNAARAAITSGPDLPEKADAVATAELVIANARADWFVNIQASPNRLADHQVAALIAKGGAIPTGFTEPDPTDFNDHAGYIALFDGVSLKGWDGNPKFWRVEGGAIVGESTVENPSGNTYIAYRDVEAHDFTLKFEMKIEGTGGSGLQYRSKTGIPWTRPIPANVIANSGPVNLNWMMTGPQADFWPSQVYTGQFYSENTPMGIMAWRGQAVEGAGLGSKRLMGSLGDRTELGKLVKMNDWNQYIVIARGGTLIHIVNGQVMAIMVDDDPASSNNQSGLFGIEIEATTKVSVRNLWLKKLN